MLHSLVDSAQRFLFRILIKILADFSKKTNGFRNFTFCFHKDAMSNRRLYGHHSLKNIVSANLPNN